jgi:hypothetical protein
MKRHNFISTLIAAGILLLTITSVYLAEELDSRTRQLARAEARITELEAREPQPAEPLVDDEFNAATPTVFRVDRFHQLLTKAYSAELADMVIQSIRLRNGDLDGFTALWDEDLYDLYLLGLFDLDRE